MWLAVVFGPGLPRGAVHARRALSAPDGSGLPGADTVKEPAAGGGPLVVVCGSTGGAVVVVGTVSGTGPLPTDPMPEALSARMSVTT